MSAWENGFVKMVFEVLFVLERSLAVQPSCHRCPEYFGQSSMYNMTMSMSMT